MMLPVLLPPKNTNLTIGPIYDGHVRYCQLLPEEYVQARWKQLLDFFDGLAEGEKLKGILDGIVPPQKNADGTIVRPFANTLALLGAPMRGSRSNYDMAWKLEECKAAGTCSSAVEAADTMQASAEFTAKYINLTGAKAPWPWASPFRGRSYVGNVEVMPGYFGALVYSAMQIEVDSAPLCGSVAFVFILITCVWYMGHVQLAILGNLANLLALPIAFVAYCFMIPITPQFVILSLFVAIGIGAANLFVYLDTWKVARGMSSMEERVTYTLERTGTSILTTNLTTAVSFYSLLNAPMTGMAALGVQTGSCIVCLFLVSVSFWPAVCIIFAERIDEKLSRGDGSTSAYAGTRWSRVPKLGRLLATSVKVGPLRFRWAAVTVTVLGMAGVFGIYLTTQLRTPTDQELPITDDYQMARWMNERPPSDMTQIRVTAMIAFGLDHFVPSTNRWDIDINRGTTIYDDAFDLSDPTQMKAVLAFADDLRAVECPAGMYCIGRDEGEGILFSQDVPFVLNKWAQDINSTLPSGEDFIPALKEWLAQKENEIYRESFGFVEGGELKFFFWFVSTNIEMMGGSSDTFEDIQIATEAVNSVIATRLGAIPGLASTKWMCYKNSGNIHTAMIVYPDFAAMGDLYPVLQTALPLNVLFCLAVSCAILFFNTRNPLLSLLGCTSVFFVVTVVFGITKLTGGELSINVMIASTIVVGFSFDYALHFACCYMASSGTAEERVVASISHLWTTLIVSAVTTALSVILQLTIGILFLVVIGKMITITVIVSVVYTLLFLSSACMILSPGIKTTADSALAAFDAAGFAEDEAEKLENDQGL